MSISKRIFLVALLAALVAGLVWAYRPASDPLFHGKPESIWIEQLVYRDEDQVKDWRKFGPEGVQVLVRGLEKQSHPIERSYRKLYRRWTAALPGSVTRFLPYPKKDSTFVRRACVVDVLSRLGKDAMFAKPSMARALRDENEGVRQLAISFFNDTEDENCILNQMDKKEKAALLPDFLDGMQLPHVRNNAAIALGFYPEEATRVTPELVKGLQDSNLGVRLVCAKSLFRVDPKTARTAGVVPVLIKILENPDDQVSHRAARQLGEMGLEPNLAVPALIASAQVTNTLVASSALWALGNFPGQADLIVPVLTNVLNGPSGSLRWASGNSLKRLDPAAAKKAGVK